jgi:hypothetical protein
MIFQPASDVVRLVSHVGLVQGTGSQDPSRHAHLKAPVASMDRFNVSTPFARSVERYWLGGVIAGAAHQLLRQQTP